MRRPHRRAAELNQAAFRLKLNESSRARECISHQFDPKLITRTCMAESPLRECSEGRASGPFFPAHAGNEGTKPVQRRSEATAYPGHETRREALPTPPSLWRSRGCLCHPRSTDGGDM